MNKYRVFFDQINQMCFEVTAKNKEDAIEKAKKEWLESVDCPDVGEVERM